MTSTLEDLAVVGRRVEFAYYRSLHNDSETLYLPGIITAVTDDVASLRVRLDGQRSNLALCPDYEGLRYLEQVVPVPALPMGRFQPGTQHPGMDFAYDGVLVVQFEEDDMVAITADRDKAEAAVATYLREQCGIDDESTIRDELAELKPKAVVFEWEPEGAECAWLMNWADEGDGQALQVHYLPAL
ncbi:hypothetical protein [Streptomyces olivochromogenes]|uniref:Uncharacterized protein n=1 Tax=Streptomyces olivochromogenes TaxID=1963 RepID=A0A250VSR9_STROL|nr:hypothetical protein [Streptomyces olivochromogenes]KUN38298.1 hypothetical protein AQJ27_45190 [Streptomyces olivochromogenes]GAX57253.1 hypothetical protein SO3561_08823 [Streptomyces olivochromogenes]